MADFFEYVFWRGDVEFSSSEFNPVDALIFSQVSYMNFDGLIPCGYDRSITVKELFSRFKKSSDFAKRKNIGVVINPKTNDLFEKIADSNRFGKVKLCGWKNRYSEKTEEQFLAFTAFIEDFALIVFRGTDDTIVGWKENFNMSFLSETPGQLKAVEYLEWIASQTRLPLRLMGHSKGGNLAVYAAAQCEPEIQKRIMTIYNNDGPGFRQEFLDSPGFSMIRSRIVRIIPESSIVGLLLLHDTEPEIIKSTQNGAMQHDGITWDVCGNHFVRAEEINAGSILFDKTLKKWMDEIEESKRGAFIEDLFSVLEAPGVETFTELQNGGLRTLKEILSKIEDLQPESKKIIQQLVKCILSSSTELLTAPLIARRDEWVQGWERETETEHFGQAEWK